MNNRQEDLRLKIQKFADDAESHGTPLSWFEELYANARRNSDEIPWARMEPHPKMVEWIKNNHSFYISLSYDDLFCPCYLKFSFKFY